MSPKAPTPQQQHLKEQLAKLPDEELGPTVESVEGVNGSTLEPVYSARKMRAYTITDSELKQIGLANIGITSAASIGSGFMAFGLDIYKDTMLAESVPEPAQVLVSYVQPICFAVGIALWIAAAAMMWWRRGMINLIKTESGESKS